MKAKAKSWLCVGVSIPLIVATYFASDTVYAAQECSGDINYTVPAHDDFPIGKCAALPGGSKIFYYDTGWKNHGLREAVIFAHAGTGNADAFKYQFRAFADAGYRAIAYDRLNVNRSSNAGAAPAASLPLTVDDLEQLANHLNIDRFHLVGVAAGAQVAVQYAAWKPKRVHNLVLAATLGPVGLTASFPELASFNAGIAMPFEVFCPANPIPAGVIPPLRTIAPTTTVIPAVLASHRELGASFRGINPEGVAFYLDIEEHSRHRTFDGCRSTFIGTNQPALPADDPANPNTPAKLAALRAHTLVLAGGGDILSPPAGMRLWGSLLPDAQWLLLGDAGHAIQIEDPEGFNKAVLRFLKGGYPFERLP